MTMQLKAVQADITTLAVDAIVNAANSGLAGGGGVDGAIHRAGGPAIAAACRRVIAVRGSLPPGKAVATEAGRLPARRVIHTVGPIWSGGQRGEDRTLENCYRAVLDVAAAEGLRSIAIPAISTGIYGFPADRAAGIAVRTVRQWLAAHPDAIDEVTFCSFDMYALSLYESELEDQRLAA